VQAKWHSYEKGDQSVAQAVGFPAGAVNYMQEIGQESYGGVILIGPYPWSWAQIQKLA